LTQKLGPGRVLDVGCGNGLLLRQFVNKGWTAHGLDISPWTKKHSKRYGFTHHNIEIEKSDLPDNHFDLVLSTSILEHIAQPIPYLQDIIRGLKPEGTLFISGVPNHRIKITSINPTDMPLWYCNFFTASTLKTLLCDLPPIVVPVVMLHQPAEVGK
jgi:2-polyprenyl-3-methyl-5-hydroxy-6-metoxy-1,4-benzoquinol methylase